MLNGSIANTAAASSGACNNACAVAEVSCSIVNAKPAHASGLPGWFCIAAAK